MFGLSKQPSPHAQKVHMHKMSELNEYSSFMTLREIAGLQSVVVMAVYWWIGLCVAVGLPTHTGSFKQKTTAQE